jgi:hypothetical protein
MSGADGLVEGVRSLPLDGARGETMMAMDCQEDWLFRAQLVGK